MTPPPVPSFSELVVAKHEKLVKEGRKPAELWLGQQSRLWMAEFLKGNENFRWAGPGIFNRFYGLEIKSSARPDRFDVTEATTVR